MHQDEARRRFAAARVARLATADPGGRPHLVPVTFAVGDGEEIYSAVDTKPKTSRRLKRLANIEVNPAVTLLVDHYAEDWAALWWVRADGWARVEHEGPAVTRAVEALVAKYPQYRETVPEGPVVVVSVTGWRGWAASG